MQSGIHPGEQVDRALTPAQLLDAETQNWFKLLHHYESTDWGALAPTECLVEVGSGYDTANRMRRLGEIPAIAQLLPQEGSGISIGDFARSGIVSYGHNGTISTTYALRQGFTNPAENRKHPIREAHSIQPVSAHQPLRIEAGLGFAFFGNSPSFSRTAISRSLASYTIVLSLTEEDPDNIKAKRVDKLRGVAHEESRTAIEIENIDSKTVADFLQIYRDSMWNTVFEPM